MHSLSTPPFSVEPSPAGGFRVMLRGHDRPVSCHDTEEEAVERMAAYLRGWQAARVEPQESAPAP